MKTAVCTVCMPQLDWRHALAQAVAAGYRDVELLMIPNGVHLMPGAVPSADVLAEAERLGVRLVALHAGGMDGSTEESLRASAAYIASVIEEAARLQVGLVVFTGFPSPADVTPAPRAVILRRIADALLTLEPRLRETGIRVALENHYQCQIETVADYHAIFAQLADRAPHIGVTVDTGHFTASQIDPAGVVRALGRRVWHVHVKDHIGAESKGLGYGRTDNAAVVRELRRLGYAGWLSVEMEVHDRENAPRDVMESFGYMQKLLGDAT